jgi:hypothetical protein
LAGVFMPRQPGTFSEAEDKLGLSALLRSVRTA